MKILFVSTSIPPCTDMQTTRNIYLIQALLEEGNQVDILTCGAYQEGQSSFDEIMNQTKIYRTKFPLIYRWHIFAQKVFRNTPLYKLHNVLINYYAKPDLYARWEKYAIDILEKKHLYDYDCVITSSGSYTAHEVGKEWKRTTNKTWVAEYGDPWGLDAYGNKNLRYFDKEHELLKRCDGIVFTTQATIDAYKKNYHLNLPYCLVQCGYGEILYDGIKRKEEQERKLEFTYTGVAYKKARNLAVFLNVINNHKEAKVKIVGTYSESLKKEFEEANNIEFLGRVAYKKSLDILTQSDVLVHIGNYGTLQVPGKTYIYLSTQKPILYIQQEENNDPTYKVLSEFEGVVFCRNNEEEIGNAVKYIVNNYAELKQQAVNRSTSLDICKYRWDKLGDTFCSFVSSCNNTEKVEIK